MRVIKLRQLKRVNGLHYAPDGRLLVCGGAEVRGVDDAIWVNVADGREMHRLNLMADCYAVTPDLSKMAIGSARDLDEDVAGTHLAQFDPAANGRWHTFTVTDGPGYVEIFGLAFDPAGKRLAVSFRHDEDGSGWDEFFVLPVGKGGGKRVEMDDGATTSGAITFSPDGKRIATSGGLDGPPAVVVVDGKALDSVQEFEPNGTQTRQLVFSPSGAELAIVNGRNVHLLPADADAPRLTLTHPKQVNAVAFSPDGRKLLSACHDKQARVWDVRTGELLHSYDWKVGAVTALAFAPDGLTVAAGGEKGQVVIWDWE